MHRLSLWYFIGNLSSAELDGVKFKPGASMPILHLGYEIPSGPHRHHEFDQGQGPASLGSGRALRFCFVFSPHLLSFFIIFCEYSPQIIIKLFEGGSLCYKSNAAIWVVSKGTERKCNPKILFRCACLSEKDQAGDAIFN